MMKIIFILMLIIVIVVAVSATIINIPDDYETIQEGINASSDGDTVLVQPGTYVENIIFNGHNIVLGSHYLLTSDTIFIDSTIIDGNFVGSTVHFYNYENDAIITGFTIQNSDVAFGGGISCIDSSPTIRKNKIIENSASFGGGIFCSNADPIIIENYIFNNSADHGGGIAGVNNAYIYNNVILNNHGVFGGGITCYGTANAIIDKNIIASNFGHGIYHAGSSVISNNTIRDNYGSGIYYADSSTILNNEIYRNSSSMGGGISGAVNGTILNNLIYENTVTFGGGISGAYNTMIINNTIFGNLANYSGGGIYYADSTTILINSILYNNIPLDVAASPIIIYSCFPGGWQGEGNISSNPLLRNPYRGDFHLMAIECGDSYDSPCIDAGHPAILDSLLDCDWGLGTILSDMGAYGGGDSAGVGVDDLIKQLPKRFTLSQNYPNPFNTSTIIHYNLPEPSAVTIDIYDILGRKVETLIDEPQPAGHHQVVWQANKFSSGIYFYKLTAGEYENSRKMVLLK